MYKRFEIWLSTKPDILDMTQDHYIIVLMHLKECANKMVNIESLKQYKHIQAQWFY